MTRTILLIVLLITGVAGLLALSIKPKPVEQPETQASVAQTTLALTQPIIDATGSAKTNVLINTQGNKVTAVQLEMTYDPTMIGNIDIKPGTFFTNPVELLKKTDNGEISYAIGISLGQHGVSGNGTVATISFTKLSNSGKTSINFASKSLVSAEGVIQSVLRNTKGVTFDLSTLVPKPSAATSSAK